ncbi:MAG: glycosyltransferase family 39 protein [Cyanobacteriota bacterium]|nr:glycosyltransferase family 39 protein [Cyanobacteriota bacterium]
MRHHKWIKLLCILLLTLGILLRFTNLGLKFYWADEVRTSMRVSGYTESQVIDAVYLDRPIPADTLHAFHSPAATTDFGDTLQALKSHPEHPPLYYTLTRYWVKFGMGWFDDSVTVTRSLAALISIFVFPCLYWFCRELFESPTVAWMAIGIFAISPLHLLYAYEARQYSLWTVAILLSNAALLRAMRLSREGETREKQTLAWGIYAFSVAFGCYSHLFFVLVAIAQGIYVLVLERARFKSIVLPYLVSGFAGMVAFTPWIWVIFINTAQISQVISEGKSEQSIDFLINRWFRNINRVFFNTDLTNFNIVLTIFAFFTLYFIIRHAPKSVWLLFVAIIGVNALSIMLPDAILGGRRSSGVRYLFPSYIHIQLLVAYCLTTQLDRLKAWKLRIWQFVAIAILSAGTVACLIESQQEITWSKSNDKALYYIPAGDAIAQTENPLIISDASPVQVLTLSYRLSSNVHLLLSAQPNLPQIPDGFGTVFLLNPSPTWKAAAQNDPNWQLETVVERREDPEHELKLYRVNSPDTVGG